MTAPALHWATPLVESLSASERLGRPVWLKLDALQPPGSFKIRGVGLACQAHAARGVRRLVSSSGGNAGIAVAYAGRKLGLAVDVVVPQTTSERARELIRQQGARLQVHGDAWHQANEHAQSLLGPDAAFIHPFDDPLLWQGHATLVDELAQPPLALQPAAQAPWGASGRPAAVVLSVGGGGLYSGVVAGLRRNGWADVPVVAAETHGADALARSLAAGARIRLEAITSVATSLGAPQVCEQAFALALQHPTHPVVVSDADAWDACRWLLAEHRLVVEPACGAALAALNHLPPDLPADAPVVVVVCGGVTATAQAVLAG